VSYRQKITCLKRGILKGSHITRWSIVNKVEHFRRCSISWQFLSYFPKNSITSVWLTVLNLLFENVPLCIIVDYYPLLFYNLPGTLFNIGIDNSCLVQKKKFKIITYSAFIYILKKELAKNGRDYKWWTSKHVNRFVVLWHWWSSIHKEV
jgi:hypothetical protein